MESLASDLVRLATHNRILSLTEADKRLWGKMTCHQMICHLSDSYLLALGEKSVAASPNLFQRTVIKFFALYVPMKWPRGVPTMAEMEQGVGGTPPSVFEEDQERLLANLDRFRASKIDASIPHPIFGAMSAADWLRWGYLHADHHLRQFAR